MFGHDDHRRGVIVTDTVARLARTYRPGVAAARASGRFAHSAVIATLPPSDWQMGQDAEMLAHDLVERACGACTDTCTDACSIVVEIALDPEHRHLDITVTADGTAETVRLRSRRPRTRGTG